MSVLVAIPLAMALSTGIHRVRDTPLRTAALVTLNQGMFHWLFTGQQLPEHAGTASTFWNLAGHSHQPDAAQLIPQIANESLGEAHQHGSTPTMWFSHLLAATGTFLLLRGASRGLSALRVIARLLATRRLTALLRLHTVELDENRPLPCYHRAQAVCCAPLGARHSRGPPALNGTSNIG